MMKAMIDKKTAESQQEQMRARIVKLQKEKYRAQRHIKEMLTK